MNAYFFILELLISIWKENWKKKALLLFVLFLTISIIVSNIAIPLVFKHSITLLSDQSKITNFLIPFMLLLYGTCWTCTHIFNHLREMTVFQLSEACVSAVSLRIFKHLHSLDMSFQYERKTGHIINTISRTQSVFVFILWGILYVGPTIVEIIIAAGIICYFYGLLYSILLLVILGGYLFFTYFADNKINQIEENAQEQEAESSSYMVDSLLNAETVKYFNNYQHEYQHYKLLLKKRQNALVKENKCRQIILIGQSLIAGCGLSLFTFLSGTAIANNHLHISDFVLINGYFLQFIGPLVSFGFYARSFKKYLTILQEVIKLLQIKPLISDNPHALSFTDTTISVAFQNVSFWHENKCILDSLSFTIPAGQTVAIVGETGAGKSTISKLLYRLYDATSGTILINGIDIKKLKRESLQQAIGVVPQDTILFNNTIYYNIAYAKPNATAQEIEFVVAQAGLHNFIHSLPDGYQTMVGERGLKLSGGEKQRIAIARTLLKNPLLYIFDEATASLDTMTEKKIQKNIETIATGATKLIIAHRLSTIISADTIIVLQNGKIIEHGTHATLLNRNNYYHSLWTKSGKP